jgi:hypothetical protein
MSNWSSVGHKNVMVGVPLTKATLVGMDLGCTEIWGPCLAYGETYE